MGYSFILINYICTVLCRVKKFVEYVKGFNYFIQLAFSVISTVYITNFTKLCFYNPIILGFLDNYMESYFYPDTITCLQGF